MFDEEDIRILTERQLRATDRFLQMYNSDWLYKIRNKIVEAYNARERDSERQS